MIYLTTQVHLCRIMPLDSIGINFCNKAFPSIFHKFNSSNLEITVSPSHLTSDFSRTKFPD